MKKFSTKILLVILTLLTVFCINPAMTAKAANESVTVPDGVTEPVIPESTEYPNETSPTVPETSVPSCFDYAIEDGKVNITYCDNSASGELVIPEYIDGYPVTRIDDLAFWGCANLTSVTIPDSVTTIGTHAFEGCSGLTEMTIPDSVTRIEDFLFAECTGLTSVMIPDGVTSIGVEAFIRCSGLTVVDIPDSVTSIDEGAFNSCTSLTSFIIPDNVTSIGNGAFYDCSGLTSLGIGDGVTGIGDHAFYGCSGLTSVLLPNSVTFIGIHAFEECSSLTEMTIPGSLSSIEEYAFANCTGLTSVTIENGVTSIGEDAFQNCISLTSITIPDSVTYIGPWAFNNCAEMTSVSIGNGVTCIGNNAFRECFSLTSLTIGNSVEIIERGVFSLCTGLTSVTIPDSVIEMGNGTFYGCDALEKVTIGNCVTYIGDGAFTGCSALTDVYYNGTQDQFEQIYVSAFNEYMLNANLHLQYVPGEDACDHAYDPWEVTVSPTFFAVGWMETRCSLCDEVVNKIIPVAYAWISQWNITLDDDFRVNFYLEISESIESTAKVKIIIGDKVETLPVSALERAEDFTYIATAKISAAQMNENIIVMVINGREIGSNAIYSVRQYCDTILADDAYSQYHTIVKEMLNYGAMAQIYFDYDAQNLANDGITGTAAENVPATAKDISVGGKISGVNFYGASLVYRDRIAVRYYFTGDVAGLTFTANGNTYTPVAKGNLHYIEIADILPQNLDQQIVLTVTDNDGNTLSVTYNPMNYIVRMNTKGNDDLKNLLKALYNYHLAAKKLST